MPSAPTLRSLEHAFGLLAWASFALGAVAILVLCAGALLAEPAPAPEQFLVNLAVILAASLMPTAVFRILATWCRRCRASLRPAETSLLGSLTLFDDSTLH